MESDAAEVLNSFQKSENKKADIKNQEQTTMLWGQKEKIRKHIIFYGRVQGVGFRYYAVQKANQLGLTGGVENLYDGTVEMEVEGQEALIDQLILFLQNRTYIWIENMDVKTIPLKHENGFYER